MFENAMAREGVLVETCKVENMIKESLDITERLLEREKKTLHKELERLRMEKFWNLADGFRRRNVALSPVEALWVEEENKLGEDVLKVRELRHLCWQRMHADAQKLENLRAWEKQRQERQEREERRRKERQERHDQHARERERERQRQQQQQNPRPARGASHGYFTDSAPRGGRPHFDRNPLPPRVEGGGKKAMSDDMTLVKAWRSYQLRWETLGQSSVFSTPLTYTSIPWPVAREPSCPSTLTPERMAAFLLSSLHSAGKPGMDRLREAMKLWHPDKFEGRFMTFVAVSDRAVVREGVGMVARGLIELMRLQKKFGS